MAGMYTGMMVFLARIWVAFVIGVVVGWRWKPKWVTMGREKLSVFVSKAFPSLSSTSSPPWTMDDGEDRKQSHPSTAEYEDCSMSQHQEQKPNVVTEEDLDHLCQLVAMKDGGPPWTRTMDRSTPNMSCQAWQRDVGPPQYRSSTVFEDATPEMVRDFFWDDEFRLKWDDMLVSATTLEECPTTGTMIVQWRRKGVPYPSIPRSDRPRRVDFYNSSWCIRAVESKRGDGQLTACEVLLFHHEDMGIPWELAKLGIRKGMWAAVKKMDPGLDAYKNARASGAPLSRPAFMARINSKISPEYLRLVGGSDELSGTQMTSMPNKPSGGNIPKLLIFGGAVLLACSLDRGLLTKAVIFHVARTFGNIGNRL